MANDRHMCPYEECRRSFSKRSYLLSHIHSHTGEKPYKCSYDGCNNCYRRSDHLKRHVDEAHSSDPIVWRCDESDCDMVFKTQQTLKKHQLRRHTKDRYKCKVPGCKQVFKKHKQLKAHAAEHDPDLRYRCTEPGCDKAFPLPSKLIRHAKTHQGYCCKQFGCDVKLDKWSLLLEHRRQVHAPVFKCDVCEKTFKQSGWLRQHMLTHKSLRAVYICGHTDCGREYLSKRNLSAHIRSVHTGQKTPCQLDGCEQKLSTKQKMKQHLKTHDKSKQSLKKKPKKKKSQAEKMTGVTMETESRNQDSFLAMRSPQQDTIELHDMEKFLMTENTQNIQLPNLLGTFTECSNSTAAVKCRESLDNEMLDQPEVSMCDPERVGQKQSETTTSCNMVGTQNIFENCDKTTKGLDSIDKHSAVSSDTNNCDRTSSTVSNCQEGCCVSVGSEGKTRDKEHADSSRLNDKYNNPLSLPETIACDKTDCVIHTNNCCISIHLREDTKAIEKAIAKSIQYIDMVEVDCMETTEVSSNVKSRNECSTRSTEAITALVNDNLIGEKLALNNIKTLEVPDLSGECLRPNTEVLHVDVHAPFGDCKHFTP